MARKTDVLSKVKGMRQSLESTKSRRQGLASMEKRLSYYRYMDEKGKFLSEKKRAQDRAYAVVLRASVDQEDFRLFRNALGLIQDEVSSWASTINASVGVISKAFTTYSNWGLRGVGTESTAINFANRLGLSLPQGRAWSRVFKTMGISSFDELVEVYRNPLERQRLLTLLAHQEETAERREDPKIQEGISDFNRLRTATDVFKNTIEDFTDEFSLANSKLAKVAGDILFDFQPRVDPNSNVKSIGSLFTSAKEAIDNNTFEGASSLALAGGLGALTYGIKKLGALGVVLGAGLETVKTGEVPIAKTLGGLGLLGIAKFAGRLGLGPLAHLLWLSPLLHEGSKQATEYVTTKALESFHGPSIYKKVDSEGNVSYVEGENVFDNMPKNLEGDRTIFHSLWDWFTKGPKAEEGKSLKRQVDSEGNISYKPVDDVLGGLPKEESNKGFLESLSEWFNAGPENKEGKVVGLGETQEGFNLVPSLQPSQQLVNKTENNNVTFNIGDIIVQVPAGSNGIQIGREVSNSIRSTVSSLGYMSSSQIASKIGRSGS